jgi:hypothetical protein
VTAPGGTQGRSLFVAFSCEISDNEDMTEKAWYDGLSQHELRMTRLLVQALCSIYNVSFSEVVNQDRHPHQCEVRSWIIWSLSSDAGLRASQIGRIVQRRDAQVHETIAKMRERTVTTPFRNTRTKLDATFAKLNNTDSLTVETTVWYDKALSGEEYNGE